LKPKGVLIVEAGRQQKQAIEEIYPNKQFKWIETSVGDEDVFAFEMNPSADAETQEHKNVLNEVKKNFSTLKKTKSN
jgi:hypothetical protein